VLDRTYFINQLRQKRQQIITVMGQMQVRPTDANPVM